jgi:ubiquinol-cytochrome c reductase cytochrome c subunit
MTTGKRLLIPLVLVGLAALLGILVLGGPPVGATAGEGAVASAPMASGGSLSPSLAAGQELFVENCSTCHGIDAAGTAGKAPSLLGLGPAVVSLWLETGWMPLRVPTAEPEPKPPAFPPAQIAQIAAYVASLAPGGPPVPTVDLTKANVATGFDLFALNCAACHTITGAGDALAGGLHAPSLHGVTATMIAEAIETGPANMPVFSKYQLSPQQVNDVVAYIVNDIQRPSNPGGIGLGGVGPVAEGFVGLFAGVGACVAIAYWVGDRTEDDEDDEHGAQEGEGEQELAHA